MALSVAIIVLTCAVMFSCHPVHSADLDSWYSWMTSSLFSSVSCLYSDWWSEMRDSKTAFLWVSRLRFNTKPKALSWGMNLRPYYYSPSLWFTPKEHIPCVWFLVAHPTEMAFKMEILCNLADALIVSPRHFTHDTIDLLCGIFESLSIIFMRGFMTRT